jgi:hypothetical protein
MDPYGRILVFLDWSHYFFLKVAPRLYSQGWVDLVPQIPHALRLNLRILSTQHVYVFCMILTIKSNYLFSNQFISVMEMQQVFCEV